MHTVKNLFFEIQWLIPIIYNPLVVVPDMFNLKKFLFLLLFFTTNAFAEENLIHIKTYDLEQNEVADVWLKMPREYPEISANKTYYGEWKGKVAQNYINPRPGRISAGDKMNQTDWKRFNITFQRSRDNRTMLVINLYETGMVEDNIILYSPNKALLESYKWEYRTDGGSPDQGTYKIQRTTENQ